MQNGLHEDAHTAVFVAYDADIGAVGGRVGADGGVLQHLAGQADGRYRGLDFVGHIVDEVRLHLVELLFAEDGADGEQEQQEDENDEEQTDNEVDC